MSAEGRKLEIFYDGRCRVCSREISVYQRQDTREQFSFVDISSEDFDRGSIPVDWETLNRYFHVRLPSGEIRVGVEAFLEIWSRLPQWRWLERLGRRRPVKALLKIGYEIFVRIRPYLPKKARGACELKSLTSRSSKVAS